LDFSAKGGKKTRARQCPNRCGWNRVQSTRFKTTQLKHPKNFVDPVEEKIKKDYSQNRNPLIFHGRQGEI
jgi:hypothetical protein